VTSPQYVAQGFTVRARRRRLLPPRARIPVRRARVRALVVPEDVGDIDGGAGFVVECKAHKSIDLAGFNREADREPIARRVNRSQS